VGLQGEKRIVSGGRYILLQNGWQCTYPGSHPPEPGEAIKGATLVEELCDACGRDTWESRTRWALHILAVHKAKDVESCPVPAPHFRDAELGKDREFWQRWMAQVYLNDLMPGHIL